RIETWMITRLPGSLPWMREYNDALFGDFLRDRPGGALTSQFLGAVLSRWWFGEIPNGLDEAVVKALAYVAPALDDAVASQPPRMEIGPAFVRGPYLNSLASRAFLAEDVSRTPSGFEMLCRMAQFRMWSAVYRGVLPTYEALLQSDIAAGR